MPRKKQRTLAENSDPTPMQVRQAHYDHLAARYHAAIKTPLAKRSKQQKEDIKNFRAVLGYPERRARYGAESSRGGERPYWMPRELDSCVRQVKAKGGAENAWAVCRGSLGSDARIKARRAKPKGTILEKGRGKAS